MATIRFSEVGKVYRSAEEAVVAVEDFNLQIGDGEFLALLGPSGCGKSSTLRMTVGLEEVTSGEIAFDGKRVNELEPQRRNVAMGFENYSLYPNLSVEGNLRFPLEIAGVAAATIKRDVATIAGLLEIEDIMGLRPANLSGGQQQRVSLGRALVRKPAAFILDEVMSHVDAQLKFRMLNDLAQIHREFGRTTMYVTHDQLEALALAERIAVMDQGGLMQVGTPQELFLAPANMFVANFIGEPTMNMLPATVAEDEVVLGDGAMKLHLEGVAKLAGRELLFACRPQHLKIAPLAESLRAEVGLREYLGERIIIGLKAGELSFKAMADPSCEIAKGDTTGFLIAREHVLFFDPKTQQRIDWL